MAQKAQSATLPDGQAERRRANRAALNLSATMRDGSRSKARVRVIDISTHGSRIECTTPVSDDSCIWLNLDGLEAQYCRVVWHCEEFVGVEPFEERPARQLLFERPGEHRLELLDRRFVAGIGEGELDDRLHRRAQLDLQPLRLDQAEIFFRRLLGVDGEIVGRAQPLVENGGGTLAGQAGLVGLGADFGEFALQGSLRCWRGLV